MFDEKNYNYWLGFIIIIDVYFLGKKHLLNLTDLAFLDECLYISAWKIWLISFYDKLNMN